MKFFRIRLASRVAAGTAALVSYILTAVVAAAAVLLIVATVNPERVAKIAPLFLPIFAVVVCLQLAMLHGYYWRSVSATSQLVAQLQTRALGSGEVRTFTGPTEFHTYLARRFPLAGFVQVTHFSSGTRELANQEYHEVLEAFVRRGGIFRRVIVDTLTRSVWEKQKDFLETYDSKNVFLHYLPEVVVERIKLLDIMLIDNVEVCLGGGYSSGYQYPTISIRHPEIVAFFADYYRYLREKSVNIKIDTFPQLETIDALITRESRTWSRDAKGTS